MKTRKDEFVLCRKLIWLFLFYHRHRNFKFIVFLKYVFSIWTAPIQFIQQFFSALHSSLIDSKLLKTLIYLWWINMKYNWRKKMISLWQPDSIKEFWLWTDPTHTIIAKIKNDVLIIAQKRSDKQEKVDASGSTLFSVHRCFQPFHDDARVTLRPFRSLENIKTQFVCVRRHRKVTTSSWSIRFPSSYVASR